MCTRAAVRVPTATATALDTVVSDVVAATRRSGQGTRAEKAEETAGGAHGVSRNADEQANERVAVDADEVKVDSLVMGYWNDK